MISIPHIDDYTPELIPDGQWIDSCGDEVWIKDGKRHRIDGPAIIYINGELEWCLNGYYYFSFDEWLEENNEITEEQRVMLKLEYG